MGSSVSYCVLKKTPPSPKQSPLLNPGTAMEGANTPPHPRTKSAWPNTPLPSISTSQNTSVSPRWGVTARHGAHRGAVGGPRDEKPLVALGILAVQAVQHVAWLLLVQQGQHEGIVVSVPAPGQLFVSSQHELFWKEKMEKVVLAENKA